MFCRAFKCEFPYSNQPTELLPRSGNNEVLVALRLEVLFCSILFCSMKTSIFVCHLTSGKFYRKQDATVDKNRQLREKREQDATIGEKCEQDATDDKNRQLREKRVQDATIDENGQLCEKSKQDATVDENRQLREKREKREQDVRVDSTLSDATEHDKIDISVQNHKNILPDVANVYDFIDTGGNRTLKLVTLKNLSILT